MGLTGTLFYDFVGLNSENPSDQRVLMSTPGR